MEKAHRRYDISDRVWKLLEPHMLGRKGTWGGNARDNRTELMGHLGPDSTKTNYKAGEQADFLMAFTQEKHGYGESS